jgi:ABC-type uncharacterized transport system permease subunit
MDSTNSSALSNWDIQSTFQFVKDNSLQMLLIILVFAIIYAVDHITNLNTILYAAPVLNTISPQKLPKSKESRKKSKR